MDHAYGVRDVERMLRLSRSTIRALIDAGFVSPARGARGAWRFSFQDLIVLRTAQTLADAKVPQRRITRSVRELRRQLPDAMPLSGLSISAVGDHVVVREGGHRWQVESGQYLLAFESDAPNGALSLIAPPDAVDEAGSAQQWFDEAAALEEDDADAARAAYAKAIAADPDFVDAHVNLGRLLHHAKRYAQAEAVYREAIKRDATDAVLLYNLGALLDDMARKTEAMEAYQRSLAIDPDFADCHYNLALLCEQLAKPREAIRHMARYRVLLGRR